PLRARLGLSQGKAGNRARAREQKQEQETLKWRITMASNELSLIVGGTSGIGMHLAGVLAARGGEVVVTGRDQARADAAARQIGGRTRGLALDLANPGEIAGRLADLGTVKNLVIAAIERDDNSVRKFDVARAQ